MTVGDGLQGCLEVTARETERLRYLRPRLTGFIEWVDIKIGHSVRHFFKYIDLLVKDSFQTDPLSILQSCVKHVLMAASDKFGGLK